MAIAIDFGAVIFSSIYVDIAAGGKPQPEYIRHLVLNTIRHYNKRYRDKYGMMVLCMDKKSWRDEAFKYYKWDRRNNRDKDDNDWSEIFAIVEEIQNDLIENFPYIVISCDGAEADDTIGFLARRTKEPMIIISNDKDFGALLANPLVDQYRPMTKGNDLVELDDPKRFEFDLIMSGDKSDGVPNVRCDDDFYVGQHEQRQNDEKVTRAPSVTKKFNDACWDAKNVSEESLKELMGVEVYKNYKRNEKLVSLDLTPDYIIDKIVTSIRESKPAPIMKAMQYMVSKRMNLLAKELSDFEVNKNPRVQKTLFN